MVFLPLYRLLIWSQPAGENESWDAAFLTVFKRDPFDFLVISQ